MSGSNTRADTPWSPKAQAVRRAELAALIRTRFRPLLDDQARSDRLVWWDQDRVALWAANAFFIGDRADVAFANTTLRYVRDVLKPQPGPNPFSVSAWAGLLKQYARKLDADTRAYGLQFLRDNLSFGCTADYQFHGYNDNMPVMWSCALTAGGELLGEKRFTEVAWANLNQLKDLLRRRGTVSEYGMGYSTHRLRDCAHRKFERQPRVSRPGQTDRSAAVGGAGRALESGHGAVLRRIHARRCAVAAGERLPDASGVRR